MAAGGNRLRRGVAVGVAVLVLSSGLLVGAASAQSQPAEAFVVDVRADGSATVTLQQTFDLTTDSERAAFRELRDNETRAAQLRGSFADRLRGVTRTTASETGRSMSVEEPSVSVRSTAETGTVALSVTWTGLAATEGARLVLAEPFANGFEPDRQFVVRAPEGYELQTAAPEPDETSDRQATWSANRSLDGFEVVTQPADEATTAGSGPGFGVVVSLVAVLAISALLGQSRRRD